MPKCQHTNLNSFRKWAAYGARKGLAESKFQFVAEWILA